jgi:hypothetical protein
MTVTRQSKAAPALRHSSPEANRLVESWLKDVTREPRAYKGAWKTHEHPGCELGSLHRVSQHVEKDVST